MNTLLAFAISLILQAHHIATGSASVPAVLSAEVASPKVLAQEQFSLENRHAVKFVNDVFKDNILLTLAYIDGTVKSAKDVNWEELEKPRTYTLTLKPGEVFTFHEDVLPKYQGKTIKPTNAHFNAQDGFKFSGLYFGDGVCHIASLIYWVAKDAGLEVERPANHDFAVINDVPREYGVSIFYLPGAKGANAHQNLYIENNRQSDINFVFDYNGETLSVRITE